MSAGAPTDPLAAALRALLLDVVREGIREAMIDALAELRHGEAPRPALLTPDQLCAALQVSRPTLKRLIAEGCPHARMGELRRFELDLVLAWLQSRRAAAR